jgi:hypothetical protein
VFEKWTVDYLLGKPTRANRKNTIKTKVLVSDRMVAPEAAQTFVVIMQYVKIDSASFLIVFM